MPELQLVPECYAETTMVKELFGSVFYLNHAEGIHEVNRILRKEDLLNYINIGFIDNDSQHTPPYFDEFEILDQKNNVVLKKHPNSNDFLIVVNPAIEKFLLHQLEIIGISPSEFDLPNTFKEFKHLLKKQRIQYHEGYKRMILELKNNPNTEIQFIIEKINILKMGS